MPVSVGPGRRVRSVAGRIGPADQPCGSTTGNGVVSTAVGPYTTQVPLRSPSDQVSALGVNHVIWSIDAPLDSALFALNSRLQLAAAKLSTSPSPGYGDSS